MFRFPILTCRKSTIRKSFSSFWTLYPYPPLLSVLFVMLSYSSIHAVSIPYPVRLLGHMVSRCPDVAVLGTHPSFSSFQQCLVWDDREQSVKLKAGTPWISSWLHLTRRPLFLLSYKIPNILMTFSPLSWTVVFYMGHNILNGFSYFSLESPASLPDRWAVAIFPLRCHRIP